MNPSLQYRNYYKKALESCFLDGFSLSETLSVKLSAQNEVGTLITAMFDTTEIDCTYNRLVLEGVHEACKLEVVVAATNDLEITGDGETVSLAELFAGDAYDSDEKAEILCALPHVRAIGAKDMLLHSLEGRYVWVMVRVYPQEGCVFALEGMRLEFPRYSFLQYFPEIYQDNEFFDRYIGLFQSIYLDLEREIDGLPRMLDYESTDPATLAELASWLGVEKTRGIFTEEQLRYMIAHIDVFQGGKGTKTALERVIELVSGIHPKIVEQFRWDDATMSDSRRALHKKLYGASDNHFCIMLDLSKDGAKLPITKTQLEAIIESYTMLGTAFQLVFLQKASHCDTHCYLDVNSRLSVPEVATVDGVTLGAQITVG